MWLKKQQTDKKITIGVNRNKDFLPTKYELLSKGAGEASS